MVVAGSPDQRHWIRGCCDLTMRLGKVEAGVFLFIDIMQSVLNFGIGYSER